MASIPKEPKSNPEPTGAGVLTGCPCTLVGVGLNACKMEFTSLAMSCAALPEVDEEGREDDEEGAEPTPVEGRGEGLFVVGRMAGFAGVGVNGVSGM